MAVRQVDVVGIGRATVDFFSKQTGLPLADPKNENFQRSVGGSTANIVVGSTRLGLSARLLSRVGSDLDGDYVRNFLESEGIDISMLVRDPDVNHPTGVAVHSVCPDRNLFELRFLRVNAADTFHTEADFREEHVEAARVVALSGTGLSRSPGREATLKAMNIAKAAGQKLVIDLDYRNVWAGGETEYREVVSKVVPFMSVIVANSEELELIGGAKGQAGVDGIRKLAPEAIIIFKDAENGSTAYVPGKSPVFVPAFRVNLLTIRGAGDGFMAGFLRNWLENKPMEDCLRLANAVGAIQVTKLACAQGMPTLAEALAFMKNTPTR